MSVTARDVMDPDFGALSPDTSIAEAVQIFREISRQRQEKVFGMMVTNDRGELVGMLSMYDILMLIRPKHTHIWGEMNDIDVTGFIEESCRRAKSILVGDIMTAEVVTVGADAHLLLVLDIMLKKHIRRIPVLEDGKVVGIVYISRVFYHLMERITH